MTKEYSLIELIVKRDKDPSSLTEEESTYLDRCLKQYLKPLPKNKK